MNFYLVVMYFVYRSLKGDWYCYFVLCRVFLCIFDFVEVEEGKYIDLLVIIR